MLNGRRETGKQRQLCSLIEPVSGQVGSTVLGAEKAARFSDSGGNILCIHEDLAEADKSA